MRDVQVPSVAANITEARDVSEDVAERLPDLKENIEKADREYARGRQKACSSSLRLRPVLELILDAVCIGRQA